MHRYFFHTHIGDDVVVDPDGRELESADAAWEAAKVLVLQLLQGADSDPALLTAVLFVKDEAREIVFESPLSEALETEPVAKTKPEGRTIH